VYHASNYYYDDYCYYKCLKSQNFLPNRSTLHQLLTFTNKILRAKTEVDVVYMDFRKAFDSVSHNGLLKKLNSIGITGKLWSYLQWWFQCVWIGDSMSALCKVLSAVPQGSVLGPLFFVIFINDLPECIKSAIPFIFADNTKWPISVGSTTDTEEDINNDADWSHFTNLLFNVAKFSHIHFLPKSSPSSNPDTLIYPVNGNPISTTLQHKDLGITFTADLNWIEHYKTITPRADQTLGLIRRTFTINCVEAKEQFYIALVRSQLLYCSQLWRPQQCAN